VLVNNTDRLAALTGFLSPPRTPSSNDDGRLIALLAPIMQY